MKMNHYKDKEELKSQCKNLARTIEKEKGFLKEIAEICRKAYKNEVKNEKLLREFLIDPETIKGKPLTPDHNYCNGFDETPRSGGEKQICHCMFYYNSNKPKNCDGCFWEGWENIGEIKVEEFEYPSKYDLQGIGGIDLVLNYNNKVYGAEVKPPKSNETLSRMISEILTYSVVEKSIEFYPAIAVFRNSKQYDVIKKLEEEANPDWEEIKKIIMVFVIEYKLENKKYLFKIQPFI